MLEGKKVLVTGAGGFIGSHLVEALLNKGEFERSMKKYLPDINNSHNG